MALCVAQGCVGRPPSSPAATAHPPSIPTTHTLEAPARRTHPAAPSRGPLHDQLLPASMTFSELIAGIAEGELAARVTREGCLFERVGPALRLSGELAVAMHPLPAAEAELDDRLRRPSATLRLLSRWGSLGLQEAEIVLVGLSAARPASAALGVLITDRGLYLGQLPGTPERPLEPLDDGQLRARLHADRSAASQVAYVTAEADITLRRLAEVLHLLEDTRLDVALATTLPAGTRLPTLTDDTEGARKQGLCPEGLPETDAPEGSLDLSALRQGVAPLQGEEGARCMRAAGGAAALGGSMTMMLRIGDNGNVLHSCVSSDTNGDEYLRQCLLQATRLLVFPATSPGSVVDVGLPLRLVPEPMPARRGLCSASLDSAPR